MRLLLDASRGTWLLLGLVLRLALLAWGTYQDAHSTVPYTDIDYHVFNGAARYLVHACPLSQIITRSGPAEEYVDLADPPQLRGKCATGLLPSIARLMLQTEESMDELESFPKGAPTVTTDEDGNVSFDFSKSEQEKANEEPKAKSVDPSPFDPSHFFFSRLVPAIFGISRPAFRLVAGLGNPYARDTYRYTPLLAVLLAPAQFLEVAAERASGSTASVLALLAENYGKLLFVAADLLIALLMWDIMDVRAKGKRRHLAARQFGWLVGVFWLVNPFPAQISTRGSSESLLGVLVLAFLDLTLRGYPEESLPPLGAREAAYAKNGTRHTSEIDRDEDDYLEDFDAFSNVRVMAPFCFALAIHWKLYPIIYAASLVAHLGAQASLHGIRTVVQFGGLALYSLVLVSVGVTAVWGWPFVDKTLVHHIKRVDHRHNFSPFFLAAYLGDFVDAVPALANSTALASLATTLKAHQGLLTFMPQLLLTAYVGFSIGRHDLVGGVAFQTMVFVAFNKVSTSQYFMWFLWLLPIVAPYLSFTATPSTLDTRGKAAIGSVLALLGIWVAAQAAWLQSAYFLEFKGLDTFVQTWLASLLVLFVHASLIVTLVRAWTRGRAQLIDAAESDARAEKAASVKAR